MGEKEKKEIQNQEQGEEQREEMLKAVIEKYVNIKRIQKDLESQNVESKEVNLQVKIAETELQCFAFDYSQLEISI